MQISTEVAAATIRCLQATIAWYEGTTDTVGNRHEIEVRTMLACILDAQARSTAAGVPPLGDRLRLAHESGAACVRVLPGEISRGFVTVTFRADDAVKSPIVWPLIRDTSGWAVNPDVCGNEPRSLHRPGV